MSRIPPLARALGLGGVVPFVLFSLLLWLPLSPLQHAAARSLLLSYAALILCFTGALHWGLALRQPDGEPDALALLWSVCPCLAGWLALMLPPLFTTLGLALGFLLQLAMDHRRLPQLGAPDWLLRQRSVLTALVVPCLLAAALSPGAP